MSKKVLIILGHPNKQSFCGSLAKSYGQGALESGAEIKEIFLGDLQFELNLRTGYKETQELEPDLVEAQRLIKWSEHQVWVYPTWWGTYPALMKGFLDRTFLPDFAFKYRENSVWWDKFLTGKSARLLITLDAPVYYNWLMYGSANQKALKKATLGFCGIKPVRVTSFGQVKFSDEAKRQKWLGQAKKLGTQLI